MPSVTADGLETLRAQLERSGALDRPKIVFPVKAADDDGGSLPVPADEVVRVVADERTYHARIERSLDDTIEIRGLYDNARLARSRDGENHLPQWVQDVGLMPGRTVLVDVVVPGAQYGLRAPGQSAVYEVYEPPADSLADIAADLEDG